MTDTSQARPTKLSDANMTISDASADVRGRTVLDKAGDEVGEVDALMIDDQESKVRFLQVSSGGFLGVGARHFLIPVDAVTRVDADHVHVDQTRDRVAGAPAYDPTVVAETDYYNDVYGYDGFAPYWGPGYVYPRYPYYP